MAVRTPAGLAVMATGAILLLAVNLRLPYLSLKITGLVLIGTGLAGLEIPRLVSGWLQRHKQQVMAALDPVGAAAGEPRVPLDTLLGAAASRAEWERDAAVPEPAADVPGSV
jgi:hypothetical protein